jgi:hypothetical protein
LKRHRFSGKALFLQPKGAAGRQSNMTICVSALSWLHISQAYAGSLAEATPRLASRVSVGYLRNLYALILIFW